MSVRRVCVVTATRAEYGLLRWLLRELHEDPGIELQLIVTGTHLAANFGMTIESIEADSLPIALRFSIPMHDDSPRGVTIATSAATAGFADAFAALRPDIMVLLGDRYETLAAAQAAMIARIPIAHIHGGESSEGAIDEAIRHAITKMAHLHFVAAPEFRRRVIQLGEAPDRVWVVGAAGLDNIARLSLVDRATLEIDLGIRFATPAFLVTYHPETLHAVDPGKSMRMLLEVLGEHAETIVVTGANADAGGNSIRREARQFAASRAGVIFTESLGTLRYLSAMAQVDAVVGNSSSGLIEAPAMGTPTVDIGERQRGRLRAPSVIHCKAASQAVRAALQRALTAEHKAIAARRETPYGTPGAARRIADVLRQYPLEGILFKHFHDVPSTSP
jgi:UDP-hydrolysing UDP-N-acetyl-D-glucosamine 2-epimerase